MMIVGEIRGQEAYVLFQALATGHGGMATMHAEGLESAVKRLTQKPMEISPAYIPLMNIVLSVQRVHLVKNGEKKAYRRILNVNEVVDYENYRTPIKWNPSKDEQEVDFSKSELLGTIAERQGLTKEEVIEEVHRRKNLLKWMKSKNIRSYKEVSAAIAEYYSRPKGYYDKIIAAEEAKQVAPTKKA
jgi:flagellar protein FlaI